MHHIEQKLLEAIDCHSEIIAFARDIGAHPEPGFVK